MNGNYRKEYDNLKRKYEGMEMEDYREAKNKFFEKLSLLQNIKVFKLGAVLLASTNRGFIEYG